MDILMHVRGGYKKRGAVYTPLSAYFFLIVAFLVIAVLPFDIRTFTTLLLPAWLNDLVAFVDIDRLILSPPFNRDEIII
jgi:hypothetical protein